MRKFTTQILSLLTALSFAGALSAQTVEDAIGAADNATGGDKLGLTVEGYFLYGLIGGSGSQNYDSLVAENLAAATGAIKYKAYGASAIGGGLNIGYSIAENLDVVAGVKLASFTAPDVEATATTGSYLGVLPFKLLFEGDQKTVSAAVAAAGGAATLDTTTAGNLGAAVASVATVAGYAAAAGGDATAVAAAVNAAAGATVVANTTGFVVNAVTAATAAGLDDGQKKMASMMSSGLTMSGNYTGTVASSFTTTTVNLGLRPKLQVWGGEMYAGAGLNILLPTEITQELSIGGVATGDSLAFDAATITRKFGLNFTGLYGELGYNYDVMPNLYVGAGIRLDFNVANNIGETRTTVFKRNGAAVATFVQTASESHTTGDEAWSASGTTYSQKESGSYFGATDVQVQLNVGYRL